MDWVKSGSVGVGLGVVDDQMEKWDVRKGRTKSFQTATDITRAVVVVGGATIGTLLPKLRGWGEIAVIAALPLLTKSVIRGIQGMTTPAATSTASFAARRQISRSYEPEMSTTGVY